MYNFWLVCLRFFFCPCWSKAKCFICSKRNGRGRLRQKSRATHWFLSNSKNHICHPNLCVCVLRFSKYASCFALTVRRTWQFDTFGFYSLCVRFDGSEFGFICLLSQNLYKVNQKKQTHTHNKIRGLNGWVMCVRLSCPANEHLNFIIFYYSCWCFFFAIVLDAVGASVVSTWNF